MLKNTHFKKFLGPALILVAGLSFSSLQAKPSITDLTSNDTAQKAQSGEIKESRLAVSGLNPINTHSLGVGIGQTFLKSDFRPNGDDKISADLYYAYTASHSFDFLANFHTSSHSKQTNKVSVTGLALGIKGRFYQYDNFAPFLVGGFGFYQPKTTRTISGQTITSKRKITFGNHMGIGAELRLNRRVTVGTILHLHNPFDVQQDDQPEVEGSYYKLLLTALYSF